MTIRSERREAARKQKPYERRKVDAVDDDSVQTSVSSNGEITPNGRDENTDSDDMGDFIVSDNEELGSVYDAVN